MAILGRLPALLLLPALASGAGAQEVVAVLSSDMRPYQEAYAGFQEAFGKAVPVLPLEDAQIPRDARVLVAFGGKAATRRYPARVTLVYGIALGIKVGSDSHDGPSVKIQTEPEAAALLSHLAGIQPGLKRLAVMWSSKSFSPLVGALEKAGAGRSVKVVSERLEAPDELPAGLRALKGKVDAIWLPADPLLINAQNFDMIRQFSYDNGIAFYVPTEGLVERGATAAVYVSYKEVGRTAAALAKQVLAGEDLPEEVYAQRVETSVNRKAGKALP